MTDRIAGFIVTLDQNIRDDDIEPTIAAIRQLRHVLAVQPVVADVILTIAQQRVRRELAEKLWAVLDNAARQAELATERAGERG